MAIAGVLIYCLCAAIVPHQFDGLELTYLALLAIYGELRSVRLPVFGFLNAGEGFYLAAACLQGPLVGGALAATLGLLADLRVGKPVPILAFNFGWALAVFGLAGAVYPAAGWVAVALVYVVLARTLQAVGQRTFFGLTLVQTSRKQVREALLIAPASLGFCYLAVLLLELNPLASLTLVLPLELVYSYVRTRELSTDLGQALKDLELAQTELVASGRRVAVGVMAAGIAHEINNPLAAAQTNLHMLDMQVTEDSARPSLKLLGEAIDRCQSVAGRMLKYSSESQACEKVSQVSEVLDDAVLLCGRPFNDGLVKLEISLEGHPKVTADPVELVQILTNLLTNACDSGSTVVRIEGRSQTDAVTITVSDDGTGIAEDIRTQIFEPFFTTKPVGSGTGLGLSIAKNLARGCGGDLVLVTSRPGLTVFELSLLPSS
jgi:signal transduction histidine kinase